MSCTLITLVEKGLYIWRWTCICPRRMCVCERKHTRHYRHLCVWVVNVKDAADVNWACNSSTVLHQQFMICIEILTVLMIFFYLSYNNYTEPAKHYHQLHIINHFHSRNTFSVVIRRRLKILKQNTDCEYDQYKHSFYSPLQKLIIIS